MTELNLGKLFAEANRDLDKKWKVERKMDKDIRKSLNGLWLLWDGKEVAICPFYAMHNYPERNYVVYGSRGYSNKRALTLEEHKKYFALHDKIVKANKSFNRWKQSLGGKK